MKKYKFAGFQFYDRDKIQDTLEAMAQKGWVLRKSGGFFWQYEKEEGKRYHVAVVYFPDATVYDPKPSEKEEFFLDLCAEDGWELKVSWGQMKIFYNERENPTPIETDPMTQVENIHKAMKKKGVREAWLNLLLGVYITSMFSWIFFRNPAEALSQGYSLWLGLDGILMIISSGYGLLSWKFWYGKAVKAAEEGEFLPCRSNRLFNGIIYVLVGLVLVLMVSSFQNRLGFLALSFLPVILATVVTVWVTNTMKEAGVSKKKNLAATMATAMLMTFLTLGAITYISIHFHLVNPGKPVGTYEAYGRAWDVYDEDLPLEIEDLTDTEQKEWSKEMDGNGSLFASQYHYRQWPLSEKPNIPELRYEITEVKVPFLFDLCLNGLLNHQKDKVQDGEVVWINHYEPADPAPWGADNAWQIRGDYGLTSEYLLCYGNTIINLNLWETPTKQQMKIIGETFAE